MSVPDPQRLRPLGPVCYASLYSALSVVALFLLVFIVLQLAGVVGAVKHPLFPVLMWGPAAVVLLVGLLRVSIQVSSSDVVVRNVWRTHRLRWGEIREVTDRGGWRSPIAWTQWMSQLLITTDDGRKIVVQASLNVTPERKVRDALRRAIPSGHGVRWRMSFREEWEPKR